MILEDRSDTERLDTQQATTSSLTLRFLALGSNWAHQVLTANNFVLDRGPAEIRGPEGVRLWVCGVWASDGWLRMHAAHATITSFASGERSEQRITFPLDAPGSPLGGIGLESLLDEARLAVSNYESLELRAAGDGASLQGTDSGGTWKVP
jgi:hypothetical protein